MAKRHRKPKVEKYHDRVAGIYDTIYTDAYWRVVFDITWRHLRTYLPQDQSARCLDVGCGTGRWGLRLAKSGYRCDFLDISHRMLDQVDKKLGKQNVPTTYVECLAKDAVPLPDPKPRETEGSILYHASVDDLSRIPKGSYDFIIGQGDPLNCAKKPDRALKDLTRILRPAGTMVMSVDNRLRGFFHYFKDGDIDGLEAFLKTGKTRWVTDDTEEQYEITMFTPDQIERMCQARGLELLSMIGKTVLPLRRFAELLKDEAMRERLTRLEESLHRNPHLFGNAAHLEFVARKPEEPKKENT